ncbi:MAG: hypothetical protein PHE29_07815 [Tissierellia bacterium]|nr:hypothetical protein [Tissierellia bacterium]
MAGKWLVTNLTIDMISLEKFKDLLGEEAQGLTDEEIEEIREAQYKFVQLAFDEWVREKGIKLDRDIFVE